MQKRILTSIFFLVLAVFFIGTLCNLHTDFSFSERRTLAPFPDLKNLSLRDWSFDEDMERFLADHLIFRDALTGINSYMRVAAGTQRLNEIYRTKDGALVERPILYRNENIRTARNNLKHLDALAAEEGKSIVMLVPPSSGYARKDALPDHLGVLYEDDRFLSLITEYPSLQNADLMEKLGEGKGNCFYRTDNHWNADGAYAAYTVLADNLGITPRQERDDTYESYDGFRGSTRSRSALWLTPGEQIRFPVPQVSYTVQIENEPVRQDLYFREALSSHDPYAVFFNGNYGKVTIRNDAGENGGLLIIKDSFANSVVPLLLPHYRTIIMIDPRFFRGTLQEILSTESTERIACICSLKTLATDASMMLLR